MIVVILSTRSLRPRGLEEGNIQNGEKEMDVALIKRTASVH